MVIMRLSGIVWVVLTLNEGIFSVSGTQYAEPAVYDGNANA